MADKKTYTGLSKKFVSIPAQSVLTVDYMDTNPNYFRVQNKGNTAIYCATAHIPTQTSYDFMVSAGGIKLYAEPFDRSKLYLYNPTTAEIDVVIVSFKAEFDPLTYALSDLEIDLPNTIEMNGIISGFTASLPAGKNKVGSVDVAHLPDLSINGKDTAFSTVMANILDFQRKCANRMKPHGLFMDSSGSKTISPCTSGCEICDISFLSNDGESNITLSVVDERSNKNFSVTLKPGEVINGLNIRTTSGFNITADSECSWRLAWSEYYYL